MDAEEHKRGECKPQGKPVMTETKIDAVSEFDLQPDPRILPMLGEINLDMRTFKADFPRVAKTAMIYVMAIGCILVIWFLLVRR
jgi:hypothetical protein